MAKRSITTEFTEEDAGIEILERLYRSGEG